MRYSKLFFITLILNTFTYTQSSLESQLKELDQLRAKLDGLKSTENKTDTMYGATNFDIWSYIESSWESRFKGENWVDKFCSDEFNLWNYELPIPQDTESLIKNISYKKNNTKMLYYDLNQIRIVTKSKLALVYYYYNSEILDASGRVIKKQGKISDTVIRENNQWKIISRMESPILGIKSK